MHQFGKQQPDLNYRNDQVVTELTNILRYWLDRGVAGFRLNGVSFLYENSEFLSEPPSNNPDAASDDYNSLKHIYTQNMPETFVLLTQIRQLLNSYEEDDGEYRYSVSYRVKERFHSSISLFSFLNLFRVLFTDSSPLPLEESNKYYGNESHPLVDIPFNFNLINDLSADFTGTQLHNTVMEYLTSIPNKTWPNWVVGHRDHSRVASRLGLELVDAMAMIQILLGGTPIIYYGEEIGMEDVKIPGWYLFL